MDAVLNSDENAIYFPYGLCMSDAAWRRYGLDDLLIQAKGDAISQEARFARLLVVRLNGERDFSHPETKPARAGELQALMLLQEIFRFVVSFYCHKVNPSTLGGGLSCVRDQQGTTTVDHTLPAFIQFFPSHDLRERGLTSRDYLAGITRGVSNKEITTKEIILLQIAHENPAAVSYTPLFDNTPLRSSAPYDDFIAGLERWFTTQPVFPDTGLSLFEMLRAPLRECPDSLEGQLAFITGRWRSLLPQTLLDRLLVVQGVLREETMMRGHGPGPIESLAFADHDYAEPEAFSADEDWMPQVVLIAKLAYVWLDQLSRKYGRTLSLLSDIPDEELDQLAHWGFNALWLIGVWERSSASREIKQRMGNPEAASSAYSLYDYTIAQDLGGEEAYANLSHRAKQRGIRLAGDMVPNHMGIYSKWVIEHPQRFLQLRESPFPGYRYTGPDLSPDDRIGLYIEDGYWNHSDAAVVFKRVDHHTGDTTYIYHGNDGTSMPWNDTAQLNFLMRETREAVIGTILHVARLFPIIRFDAAMTLAKRHYQRLWFPKPGDGGAIPSRAEFGMSRQAFDDVFPDEFWREVVDRIAAEAPDTLLLAEAFWLMEGYFVRTLGMHRVYNSAFMNMLKMEDNAKYRQTIKNVLEFTPEVLQRFVNFMNNPDEDTAEAQFGKGDKYFGVAVLLATMPGLPMFGHGQIEGYTEKYGMEYRRAYREEEPDQGFIDRHKLELFPLLRKRYLFSGARNFALFDFVTPDGWVDENVFAYSNRAGDERALIIYNNAYNTTRGALSMSTAINEGRGEEKLLRRRSLCEALTLNLAPQYYSIFYDERLHLEYLHHNRTLADTGLHIDLHAYEYKAYIRIRQVCDEDNSWGRLHAKLGGCGVPSVDEAYVEMHLSGILDPFREFMTAEMLEHVLEHDDKTSGDLLGPWRGKLTAFLAAVADRTGSAAAIGEVVAAIEKDLVGLHAIRQRASFDGLPDAVQTYLCAPMPTAREKPMVHLHFWRIPAAYCLMRHMGMLGLREEDIPRDPDPLCNVETESALWMREWLLIKHVAQAFNSLNQDAWEAHRDGRTVYACIAHRAHFLRLSHEIWGPLLHAIFEDTDTRAVLQINRFANQRWLNKEQLEFLMYHMFLANAIRLYPTLSKDVGQLVACYETAQDILNAAEDTGYNFDWMMNALK